MTTKHVNASAMATSVNTIDDIFDVFGGTSAFAHVIERGQSTASEMRRRGSIPVEHWPKLIESEKGRALNITSDLLVTLHINRSEQRAAQ